MNNNINVVTKFASLHAAVLAQEAAGKLDLSYNRDSALAEARYTDRLGSALVFADAEGQIWFLVVAPDGLLCLNKYEPFVAVMSDCARPGYVAISPTGDVVTGGDLRVDLIHGRVTVARFANLPGTQLRTGDRAIRAALSRSDIVVGIA